MKNIGAYENKKLKEKNSVLKNDEIILFAFFFTCMFKYFSFELWLSKIYPKKIKCHKICPEKMSSE